MSNRNRKSSTKGAKNVRGAKNASNRTLARSFFEDYEKPILALISVVLIYVLWQLKNYQPLPQWDGTYYINYSPISAFPPGYPILIAILRAFVSSGVLAARIVSMVFLTGTVIVVYYLAKRYSSSGYALIAAIFTGFAPLSLRMGIETLSEATYTFLVVLAALVYALSLGKDKRTKDVYFVGLISAAAYFTRPEAAVFFVLLLAIETYKTRSIRNALFGLAGFATLFIPVVIATYAATGQLIITRKTGNFRILNPTNWFKNEMKITGQPVSAPPLSKLLKSIVANYGVNFLQEGNYLITFEGIPALLLVLWYLVKKRTFLVAALAEFFVYPIFTGLGFPQRFVYPYLPFFGVLSVAAISQLIPSKARVIAVVLLLVGVVGSYSFTMQSSDPFPELKEAGYALKPYVNQNSIILDRKPYPTYYAGLKPAINFVMIPFLDMDGVIKYAHEKKADFLVMSKRIMYIFRPELMKMFDPKYRERYSNSLQLIADLYPNSIYEVLIFRIK